MSVELLRADCARCAGLCCVVPEFAASTDFAFDKPAGTPCRHLGVDFRCGIHAELRERGLPGCTVYDCFGAGQRVVQGTFGGRDWRSAPEVAAAMFAAFPVVRLLHELRWYLADALRRPEAAALHPALAAADSATERFAAASAEALLALDGAAHREQVAGLLRTVAELVRAAASPLRRFESPGADLIGVDLADRDLRGANLRGAYLIGARLRGADLGRADLIGADLRGADLRGADLSDALFVTRFQIDAAIGDGRTRLPASLTPPAHW